MPELISVQELASLIDHAVLSPSAGLADLEAACRLAERYGVKNLCVKPCLVATAYKQLTGAGVQVGTVISFPHGSNLTEIKVAEARAAIAAGASELDMVINIAAVKDGQRDFVRVEVNAVVAAAEGRCVKAILECALLDDQQKVLAAQAAQRGGAAFVKTSTGFAAAGATVADVRLLRQTVGPDTGVKASGGIRTLDDALAMIRAGANRLGASSTASILDELARRLA